MEILNQFGFDIRLFAAQIVNFLVIAFVFKKFLYKPILETLKKRSDAIKKGLNDARQAAEALESAQAQKDELLGKASKEAERIITEAKLIAQSSKDQMIEETKKEISKMLGQTKEEIALERDNFRKESKDLSLTISAQILNTVLGELFDKKEKDLLLERGVRKIKNDKSTKN